MEIAQQTDPDNSEIVEGHLKFFNPSLSPHVYLRASWNVALCRQEP